jgi:uncharacterized protein involved in type VI secretion and phage assembly
MRNPFEGVVTGFIREIDEQNSQVRLEFPSLPASYRSHWAPIASGLSGGDRGMYFLPEEGDEALVAFQNGNFDNPFVLGFLWNGAAMPPETDRHNRVILTPGGNTLRFEDTDGAKKIVLKSSGGANVTIDDAAGTVTVCDAGGSNQVVIDAGGTVTIQAASQVVVKAPQISLTDGAAHPLVWGDVLLTYITTLVTALQAHVHPGQMAAGVLPVTPMPPTVPLPTPGTINSSAVKTG